MLTSKLVYEGVSSILDSLRGSHLEDAKRKLQEVALQVRSDKDRGSLLAAAGIYSSMSKARDGKAQPYDGARLERAAKSITASQMADEFDRGYAETLLSFSKLTQKRE